MCMRYCSRLWGCDSGQKNTILIHMEDSTFYTYILAERGWADNEQKLSMDMVYQKATIVREKSKGR